MLGQAAVRIQIIISKVLLLVLDVVEAALVATGGGAAVAEVGLARTHARASAVVGRTYSMRGRVWIYHHYLRRLKCLLNRLWMDSRLKR